MVRHERAQLRDAVRRVPWWVLAVAGVALYFVVYGVGTALGSAAVPLQLAPLMGLLFDAGRLAALAVVAAGWYALLRR